MFQTSSCFTLVIVLCALLLCCHSFAATLNVRDYGAMADGTTDDTRAFQKAVDAAGKIQGSTVLAPRGKYLIAGTIYVPANTTLQGDYYGPGGRAGTTLLATGGKGKSDGPGCVVLRDGMAMLKNVRIEYPEQVSADEEAPVPYPYAISGGHSSRIEEIYLLNAYQGINLDGSHANMVRNIWGQPLRVGIHADHIYDISRIENVHFWPYYTHGRKLSEWVQKNGVAFEFGRSDWQYCFNTFSYGYHTGYRFFHTEEVKVNENLTYQAGATNGNFVGIGADKCAVAIDVEDSFHIGVSITNGEFAPFGTSDSRGILLRKGNTGNLTLTNCNFWAVPSTLIEVQSGSLNLTACNIHEWAVTLNDKPAMLASGGRLNVSGCTFNRGGKLGRLEGADTRATFANNMGTDPLTVENLIGDRAVFSANNPAIEVTGK